ncbi:hypothetical protein [Microbispora sp. NPDC049633]|uniref:hypothetical protein n=1 Tax=Microbispora sp. NPDC049633 TaxID=3154355 RepID=UPI00344176F5
MPTTDPSDRAIYQRMVDRHKARMLYLAKRMKSNSDHLFADLEAGDAVEAHRYIHSLQQDATEAKERYEVLVALKEASFLVADEEKEE